MAHESLVLEMPLIHRFDRRNPTLVVERAAELHHPRAHAMGDALQQPEANFCRALRRILPTVSVVVADAGDPADRFSSHHATEYLCVPTGGPRWHDGSIPPLAIRGNHA